MWSNVIRFDIDKSLQAEHEITFKYISDTKIGVAITNVDIIDPKSFKTYSIFQYCLLSNRIVKYHEESLDAAGVRVKMRNHTIVLEKKYVP